MSVADNFDNIKALAVDAAVAAANKTKQVARISKAALEIRSLEIKIKKAQMELGKLYYRDYVVEEEQDIAEYLPWCKRIDDAKRKISQLQDYIEELKNDDIIDVKTEDDPVDI